MYFASKTRKRENKTHIYYNVEGILIILQTVKCHPFCLKKAVTGIFTDNKLI